MGAQEASGELRSSQRGPITEQTGGKIGVVSSWEHDELTQNAVIRK